MATSYWLGAATLPNSDRIQVKVSGHRQPVHLKSFNFVGAKFRNAHLLDALYLTLNPRDGQTPQKLRPYERSSPPKLAQHPSVKMPLAPTLAKTIFRIQVKTGPMTNLE